MAPKARYDEIADWYPTWVGEGDGLIAEGAGDLLPPAVVRSHTTRKFVP